MGWLMAMVAKHSSPAVATQIGLLRTAEGYEMGAYRKRQPALVHQRQVVRGIESLFHGRAVDTHGTPMLP